jgi:S-formylglutathione hydrolase FrmB
MALIQASFMSEALERQVAFTAILPVDSVFPGMETPLPLRTLYLLHGYGGSGEFWRANYAVDRLSGELGLAVIMPDGENHFYTDDDTFGYGWGKYVGEELVNYTRQVFPLSRKPEDTLIGGFSMGGYGALLNGLRYRETFGHIVSVSAAILTGGPEDTARLGPRENGGSFFRSLFGDPAGVAGSHHDPRAQAEAAVKAGRTPDIYMAVGKSDFLRDVNEAFRDHLEAVGYPKFLFEEEEGDHESVFAEAHLFRGVRRALGKEE